MFVDLSEFEGLLLTKSYGELVDAVILGGIPYVFRDNTNAHDLVRSHLARELDVQPDNVFVVGSASTGFSLNPENFPRPFSKESDVDIAVVDEHLFDIAWSALLKWNYPIRVRPSKPNSEWAYERRKDVYWGWLVPDGIQFSGLAFPDVLAPLRDLSARWFNAFRALSLYSEYPEIASRDVSGRLYRSRMHLLRYHEETLRRVKQGIERRRGG